LSEYIRQYDLKEAAKQFFQLKESGV